jgi:hypothetical protein
MTALMGITSLMTDWKQINVNRVMEVRSWETLEQLS